VGLTQVIDDQGHGTMVAGVIAAAKGNYVGISGIAPSSSLLVIKANEPNEGTFLDSSLIEGIYYAVDHGADIINMSLGGPYANPLTKTALEYARNQGVIVVAASGNDSVSTPYYPASFSTVISVSAVDQTKALATYSNYGSSISISAPGTNIYTTFKGNAYGFGSGTSLASPQVTGVLALMAAYLNVTDEETIERLLLTSSDLGSLGRDDYFGYGLVNSYDSLIHPLVTVSFETFGGTVLQPIKVAAARPFVCSQIPEKDLSVFSGWYQDSLLTVPWVEGTSVANANMTLYAKYTQSSYLVTFVTAGTPVADLIVAANGTFALPSTSLDQYQFVGWYKDSQFLEPYIVSAVTDNLTLYAKFEKLEIYYNVFFVTPGSAIEPLKVKEGDSFNLPSSSLAGHTFQGWYKDSNCTVAYQSFPVMSSITLYALFTVNDYHITYWLDQVIFETLSLPFGSDIPLLSPSKLGHSFSGWFLDVDQTALLVETTLEGDLVLYGGFSVERYLVVFMMDDTIISQSEVNYQESAIAPEPPAKPDSVCFFYQFSGWSDSFQNVTFDLIIEPVFIKTFKPESVSLKPGVDTVHQGDDWVDAGVNFDDACLTVTTQSLVDTNTIGRYAITYSFYDQATMIYEIKRIVSVIEKPEIIQITLLEDVTTIYEGQTYVDPGATTNIGTITKIGDVNNLQAGVYVITYEVVYQNITFQKHKYVYVLKVIEAGLPVAFLPSEKKWWYEL